MAIKPLMMTCGLCHGNGEVRHWGADVPCPRCEGYGGRLIPSPAGIELLKQLESLPDALTASLPRAAWALIQGHLYWHANVTGEDYDQLASWTGEQIEQQTGVPAKGDRT